MKRRGLVIAIDGTIGTGKTTTARQVAERLGYRHLDTGAMYRAVALAATRRGVGPEDEDALEALLATSTIDLDSGRGRVLLDGQDISEAIRRPRHHPPSGRLRKRTPSAPLPSHPAAAAGPVGRRSRRRTRHSRGRSFPTPS